MEQSIIYYIYIARLKSQLSLTTINMANNYSKIPSNNCILENNLLILFKGNVMLTRVFQEDNDF